MRQWNRTARLGVFGAAVLGLAGIAILAALIASQHNGNDNNPPVSVN